MFLYIPPLKSGHLTNQETLSHSVRTALGHSSIVCSCRLENVHSMHHLWSRTQVPWIHLTQWYGMKTRNPIPDLCTWICPTSKTEWVYLARQRGKEKEREREGEGGREREGSKILIYTHIGLRPPLSKNPQTKVYLFSLCFASICSPLTELLMK